jgi:flagellar hook-associated protein 1 FlgK
MAGLLTELSQTAGAMDAQQLGLQITGNNLANVNNPNYSRQTVALGAVGVQESGVGEISMGVVAEGIQQDVNPFLNAQVTQEISQTGTLQAQVTQLTQAQSYLGEQVNSSTATSSITNDPSSTSGISTAMDSFFNAFSSLAATPTDTGAQQTVVQTAGTLADTINTTNSQLQSLQGDINTQINQDVGTVNGLLKGVATLNGQIAQYDVQNPHSTANDLNDQRQADLEQLAGYMNFTTSTVPNSNGQIQITALDQNSNPVTLVSNTSVEGGGIAFTGTSFTGGVPTTTLGLTGGSLQGNLTASTGAVQTLMNNLSNTASQLTSAVNAAYNPTGTTGNFFQSTPSTGDLITLDPTLTATTVKSTGTGNAGANELALAVSNIPNKTFSTSSGGLINGTIGGYYSAAVTGIGESIDSVQSQLSDQTAVQTLVQSQQASVSGVNQDDELTHLMTYQSAFQAQAQVINTINTCMDSIISTIFGGTAS